MQNLLLQPVDFQVEKTAWGTWRRHLSVQGSYYAEFTSHAELLGWPLLHYTRGINPQTGRRTTARGVIAVGRVAVGGLALGQAAFGLCAIGQVGLGLLFGLGQASCGWYALGQLALGGGVRHRPAGDGLHRHRSAGPRRVCAGPAGYRQPPVDAAAE